MCGPTTCCPVAHGKEREQKTPTTTSTINNDVYKFNVTPEVLDIIKATLPLVAQAGVPFTQHFYKRMMTENPELMNLFNQTNQAKGRQPSRLLCFVGQAATLAIETGEISGKTIEALCQKHVALGIKAHHYDIVGENLLATIEELLTDDKGVLGAWAALYGELVRVLVQREDEIAELAKDIPGSWYGKRTFELVEKERLSNEIIRFKFEPVDGEPTPVFTPGSYTTVWVTGLDEEGPYGHYHEQPRHYTLAMPRDGKGGDHLSISCKKEGLVSTKLHDSEIGSQWDLSAPFGEFSMADAEQRGASAPVVFISAGVGITPVLAMLEGMDISRPTSWLYVAKSSDDHPYSDRIRKFASEREELKRRVWYTKPTEKDGQAAGESGVACPHMMNSAKFHYTGRLNLEDLAESADGFSVLHLTNENASYYLCGPEGFMAAQRESLEKLGVAKERIHWEGF